jgi:hypothetical protein
MPARIWLRFATGVLATLCTAAVATACVIEVHSLRSTIRHAKAVFAGEVLEIADTPADQRSAGVSAFAVRLRVERHWKRVRTSEVVVHTGITDCDVRLEVGRAYLVYGFGKTLEVGGGQGRARELRYANDDLRVLGPGKKLSTQTRSTVNELR